MQLIWRKCCNFEKGEGDARKELGDEVSGGEIEELVDKVILLANISGTDPPRLALPDHVYSFVSRKRSPRGVERAKALLGLHPPFNRAVILLQEVVQVLDWAMAAASAQGSFFTAAIAEL